MGLGPYKFVSHTPGIELVMEAYEGYWRKMPSVKRLVYKSVPEATTRVAMLKRGEVDLAYLLDAPQALELKSDPLAQARLLGRHRDVLPRLPRPVAIPKSPWHDRRVRLAASHAIDRQALSEAETLGASRPTGSMIPRKFEFALPLDPHPYDPAQREAAAGRGRVPQRLRRGRSLPLAALRLDGGGGRRLPGRGRHQGEHPDDGARRLLLGAGVEEAHGALRVHQRGVRQRRLAHVRDGAERRRVRVRRLSDIDALYKQQSRETDARKREAQLHQIQRLLHERVRFAPIMDFIWPSGVGARVAEPALMLIDPYPWSAPLEDVRLKK